MIPTTPPTPQRPQTDNLDRSNATKDRQAQMLDVTGGELLVLVGAAAVFLGP
jgi:hypothetical protein